MKEPFTMVAMRVHRASHSAMLTERQGGLSPGAWDFITNKTIVAFMMNKCLIVVNLVMCVIIWMITIAASMNKLQWPLLLTWINFNLWLSNNMYNKVGNEIAYPFQNFNCFTAEVWERISNFTLHIITDVITYTMVGFKLNHVSKRWSRCLFLTFSFETKKKCGHTQHPNESCS